MPPLKESGWTPADEQKPKEPGYYKVCEMGNHMQRVYYLPEFDWWMCLDGLHAREIVVTHWRKDSE